MQQKTILPEGLCIKHYLYKQIYLKKPILENRLTCGEFY